MRARWWGAVPALALAGVAGLLAACTGSADPASVTAPIEEDEGAPVDAGAVASTPPTAPAEGDRGPGASDVRTSAVTSTTTTVPVDSTAPPAGNAEVLSFSAPRLSGGTFDAVQLAGHDVALWMWAPWCPQCNREASHVAAALEEFRGQVTILGIAGHDTVDAHAAFVEEHGLDQLPNVVDEDGSLWARFGIDYQPAWVFIDEDGETEVIAGGLYDELGTHLQGLVDR